MSKRQKTHQLVVTVTHDAPVTQRESVRMFRDAYCWPEYRTDYSGNVWRTDIDDTVDFQIEFKSVKAYKP